MKVMIIDDSVVMRKIVERALRQAGLELGEVLHAANGIDGLAALENDAASTDPLGLILCDLHMPGMDGLEFLLERRRRNLAPRVPVVMITAEASDPEVLKAMEAGAQGYIAKPFTVQQIRTSITPFILATA